MTLMGWEPKERVDRLRRDLERFFDPGDWPRWQTVGWQDLSLDVEDKEDRYIVTASVPGFAPEDVDVSVSGRNVTISAESKREEETEDRNHITRERYQGSLKRTFTLPSEVNADQTTAVQKNGVLTLSLPKSLGERTKKISVKGA